MCVIAIYRNKRETEENLRLMEKQNGDGTGVIYYSKGMPTYQKGITIKEAIELNKVLPFPYAFHFRITTVGQNKLLTHPYEVTRESQLRMEGQAETLLMHNGHWGDWAESVLKNAINSGIDCPAGDWSDSRAMAHLGGVIGINMLKMLTTQKIAIFEKNKKITMFGTGWTAEKDVYYSNKYWEKTKYEYTKDYVTTKYGYWENGAFHKNEDAIKNKWPDEKQPELPIEADKDTPALAWDNELKEWVEIKKEVEGMQKK